MVYLLKTVIFYSYVKSPEGTYLDVIGFGCQAFDRDLISPSGQVVAAWSEMERMRPPLAAPSGQ